MPNDPAGCKADSDRDMGEEHADQTDWRTAATVGFGNCCCCWSDFCCCGCFGHHGSWCWIIVITILAVTGSNEEAAALDRSLAS